MFGQSFPTRRSLHDESLSESLLELESELRKAYVLKALEAQVTEKRCQRMSDDIQERIAADLINVSNRSLLTAKFREQEERSRLQNEHRAQLDEQILEKELQRQLQMEEDKLERKVLIEADRQLEEEEQRQKMLTKTMEADKSMRQIQIHREMKEIVLEKEVEREAEEDKRNRRHQIQVEDRKRRLEEMKRTMAERRSEVIEAVSQTLMEQDPKVNERKAILEELAVQEMQQEAAVQALENQLRRERMTRELVSGLKEQMAFEDECRRRFEVREREFAEGVMLRIMESERMERLGDQVRKRLRARYREDLKVMMEERKRLREEELARIEESWRIEEQRQEAKAAWEREERTRLLAAHAGNVGKFINKGKLGIGDQL